MFAKSVQCFVLLVGTFFIVGCAVGIDSNIEDNSIINKNKINITYTSYGDVQIAAFDFDNVEFKVNDIDRSKEFKIIKIYPNIIGTFSPTMPLPEGNVTIYTRVPFSNIIWKRHYGRYGVKSVEKTIHMLVDTKPPQIDIDNPKDNSIVKDEYLSLSFLIDDNGSGIFENPTIQFLDTNESFDLVYNISTNKYIYTPNTNNAYKLGEMNFIVSAKDQANNITKKKFSLYVKENTQLGAFPIATPRSAYAPATIRFTPKVTTNNAVQSYSWDFDGDGNYDRRDILANSYTWAYTNPGDYNVSLKVIDATGKTIIGNTIVHILYPLMNVDINAVPSNGSIPLSVNFNVTVENGNDIVLYEWDFDGDGNYDYSSENQPNTTYRYDTVGTYSALLRITKNDGTSSIYTSPVTKVFALDQNSPSVEALATPISGNAPLQVNFSANVNDPLNKGFKLYQWDFDGDGNYDYNSTSSATTSYTYTKAKQYFPQIKVTTNDNRVTYDSIEINTNQSASLEVLNDTIDTFSSETSNIKITLSAEVKSKVIIEDSNYKLVKTIINDILSKGIHNFTWDGTDEEGKTVKEGKYYAVLIYEINGNEKRLDLRNSTGGIQYNPARTEATRQFAPFDNSPMKINFTLPRASEVISFMGYSYSNMRIVTFRNREALGKGTYTDTWNSQNDEGVLVTPPPEKYFMYGIWAYYLADNAIYIKSGVHITNLKATPPIFTPDSHEQDSKQSTLKVYFNLNKNAKVLFELYDSVSGSIVSNREYKDLKSGDNIIEFDGKDNKGVYLHPGKYTIGIKAIDNSGYKSLTKYTVMRIKY